MIPTIPLTKQLEPYFKVAEQVAKESPCIRRQYGSVIVTNYLNGLNDVVSDLIWHVAECNRRVSKCCNGICARDRYNTRHGQRTEVGAEIHSEIAALISSSIPAKGSHFVLVGFENGHEILGPAAYPCHACIKAIKFAGYTNIYMRNLEGDITPISVAEILRYREEEWEPDV